MRGGVRPPPSVVVDRRGARRRDPPQNPRRGSLPALSRRCSRRAGPRRRWRGALTNTRGVWSRPRSAARCSPCTAPHRRHYAIATPRPVAGRPLPQCARLPGCAAAASASALSVALSSSRGSAFSCGPGAARPTAFNATQGSQTRALFCNTVQACFACACVALLDREKTNVGDEGDEAPAASVASAAAVRAVSAPIEEHLGFGLWLAPFRALGLDLLLVTLGFELWKVASALGFGLGLATSALGLGLWLVSRAPGLGLCWLP